MQKKDHEQDAKQAYTHQHPKQDFHVKRIAFFSDAIFAIAITLLVIEFKIFFLRFVAGLAGEFL